MLSHQTPTCTRASPLTLKRLLLVLASTLAIAHLHQQPHRVDAKPLNVNQVKFRRLPPKEFSAALGSSITIECEAGGSPPPTIYWLKDGKRIVQNELDENLVIDPASGLAGKSILVDDINRIALSSTRSRLFIDCASMADEATYTCVADNEYSQVSSNTKLNLIVPPAAAALAATGNELTSGEAAAGALSELAVAAASGALRTSLDSAANGPGASTSGAVAEAAAAAAAALTAMPQCLSERSRPQPARIHMYTHNIVEIMSNNVLLYCRSNIKQHQPPATGGRRFSVSWTTPDGKLVGEDQQDKDKYEVLETGDLLIKSLVWADMGSYVCTVSDEQSSDTVSAFVYPASVRANTKPAASSDPAAAAAAAAATTTTATTTTTTMKKKGATPDQPQHKWS